MSAGLTATEMTLAELLSGALTFEIPEFQRDYRWSQQEARQLFEDVATATLDFAHNRNAAPYFLGAVVLLDHPPETPGQEPLARRADIVDGQQRLITLSILIACLRDLEQGPRRTILHALVASSTAPGGFQLTLRAEDQPQLEKRVLVDGATRTRGPSLPESTSVDNMLANRNLFLRELRTLSEQERQDFADYLRFRCRLLVMRTEDIDYAYQIFLTINDRGRQLSREDILRAEIIGPLSQEQRTRYEAVIDEFARYQTEAQQERTKKGKTFFSHLAAIHGAKGKSIIAEIRSLVRATGGPSKFGAQVFVPLADAYLTVKNPAGLHGEQPAELAHLLTAFRWYEAFGDDDWVPLAMLWLSRFGDDTARNIAFFRALDRFSLALRALGTGYRTRERRYAQVRMTLLDATAAPDPAGLFALSASEQRLALNKIAKRSWVIDPQLCRLILMRLDAHISGRSLGHYEATLGPRAFTIEHILPRAANPPKVWQDLFPSARRRASLAQCLGNLILVSAKVNEAAAARSFADKRALYFAARDNPFHLTNLLDNPSIEVWTEEALLRRQATLLQAVQEIWGFAGDLDRVGV